MAILERDLDINTFESECIPAMDKPFHDRRLGRLFAEMIIRIKNHDSLTNISPKIAEQVISLNIVPSRTIGRSLSKLIARLEDSENSSLVICNFIDTIKKHESRIWNF